MTDHRSWWESKVAGTSWERLTVARKAIVCFVAVILLMTVTDLLRARWGLAVALTAGIVVAILAVAVLTRFFRDNSVGSEAPRWTVVLPFIASGLFVLLGLATGRGALLGAAGLAILAGVFLVNNSAAR